MFRRRFHGLGGLRRRSQRDGDGYDGGDGDGRANPTVDGVRWMAYGGHRTVDGDDHGVRWMAYGGWRIVDGVRWTSYVGHRTVDIVRWA